MEFSGIQSRYAAVIPARAGSKRLPGKNMLLLEGKPMIGYSITAATDFLSKSSIFVTSDDLDVLSYAATFGVNCHDRHSQLASDSSTTAQVLEDLENKLSPFQFLILLQPTSPLRTGQHLTSAVSYFEANNFTSIASGIRLEKSKLRFVDDSHKSISIDRVEMTSTEFFLLNGAIYIAQISELKAAKWNFAKLNSRIFEMPENESIDVDTKNDFLLAQFHLRNRN